MTRDDIIRMALEVGFVEDLVDSLSGEVLIWDADTKHLERFAALVEKRAIAASMPAIKLAMAEERKNGAREERQACADICDQHASVEGIAQRCAAEIRKRGEV
jgi:hypothetical protein